MKPLLPGQAGFLRRDGKLHLVVCDDREPPRQGTDFLVRGGIFGVQVEGVTVPVLCIIVRLTVGGEHRLYVAWIDELDPDCAGVAETFATQPELTVFVANPLGKSEGSATIPNGLRPTFQKQLAVVSAVADKATWGPGHFAAARAFVEFQHPTAEALWRQLGGE